MADTDRAECRRNSWLVALAGGALVALMLLVVAQFGWLKALVIGAIFCAALGIFLVWAFCSRGRVVPAVAVAEPAGAAPKAMPPAEPATPAPTPAPASRPGPAAFVSAQPAAAAPERAAATPEPPKPAPAPENKPPVSAGLAAALAKSKDEAIAPAPEMLAAPRGGSADDLKMIRGIGPKLEALLNAVGVWHFDQIASWKARDIAFVDEKLVGFRGRITRDEWVKQAKLLARGGTTEFSERVKKGDVY